MKRHVVKVEMMLVDEDGASVSRAHITSPLIEDPRAAYTLYDELALRMRQWSMTLANADVGRELIKHVPGVA